MIHILGTSHDIQYGENPRKSPKLYRLLDQMITDLNIAVLAEEVNSSNFQKPTHWMIVRELSQKHRIEHIQCEPELEERSKYGLLPVKDLAKYFNLVNNDELTERERKTYAKIIDENNDRREHIWFDKLKSSKDKNVLLIIGYGHISEYSPRNLGMDTIFAENGWDYYIHTPFL